MECEVNVSGNHESGVTKVGGASEMSVCGNKTKSTKGSQGRPKIV